MSTGTGTGTSASGAVLGNDSTLDEIQAVYLNNCDYDLTQSRDKAQQFVKACRMLLLKMPQILEKGMQGGTARMEYTPEFLRKELDKALNWLNSSANSAQTTRKIINGGGWR